MQTRYESGDSWVQTQPLQGQSWAPVGSGNNGSYGPQAPQNNPPPQPPGNLMYNPPPTPYSPGPVYNGPPAYNAVPNNGLPAGNPAYTTAPVTAGGYPTGYPNSGQGFGSPGSPPPGRPVTEVAAASDLFNPAEPMMNPPTGDPVRDLPLYIKPEETTTGRLMFGVGVNSDAGLVGNITLDEQNFDWTKVPTSWEDIMEGRAFRGAGEKFRLELVPGTQVQRYMISFTEPNLDNQPVSLSLSGFFYQRIYPEWTESRAGGSARFGLPVHPRLDRQLQLPRTKRRHQEPGLSCAVAAGRCRDTTNFISFGVSLRHDTRDNPFLASEGHLLSGTVQETVGSFQYPTASVELSQYFRIFERADRSGKHVLSFSLKAGYTGDDTPIFERYYAGGFSTLRGFAFRGVTPRDPVYNMGVGGDFQMLSTAQYMFPITADDMLKGVLFVDAGTIEPTISQWLDKVRVAPASA